MEDVKNRNPARLTAKQLCALDRDLARAALGNRFVELMIDEALRLQLQPPVCPTGKTELICTAGSC
jgi:hypothetical protein